MRGRVNQPGQHDCDVPSRGKYQCFYQAKYRAAGTNGVGNYFTCGSHMSTAVEMCIADGAETVSVARVSNSIYSD